MTNNMLQTTAYAMSPYIFAGREAGETYRAQQSQKQIRAFITGEGHLSPIYSRIPGFAITQLCDALTTLTGKEYDETREGLVKGWHDLEQLVLAWQSPYGAGWNAVPVGD